MDIANAPKKQPCPECGAWVKRLSRTPQLATYEHKRCNISFMESLRPNRRNVAIIKRIKQLELQRRSQKMARAEAMQVHPAEGPAQPKRRSRWAEAVAIIIKKIKNVVGAKLRRGD